MLDAGCGSGRVTQLLLDRLPRGHVVAVDSSESMVEHAREALDGDASRCSRRTSPSSSWTSRSTPRSRTPSSTGSRTTTRLFARLHAALRPGGPLVAQCGGKGNVARFHAAAREVAAREPYAEHLAGWTGPWNFAGAEETAERLERAGFAEIDTWLEPYPVTPEDPLAFVTTVCLGPHLQRLPGELRDRLRARPSAIAPDPSWTTCGSTSTRKSPARAQETVQYRTFVRRRGGCMLTCPSPGGIFRPWQGCLSAC